jgi:hypothetical protein
MPQGVAFDAQPFDLQRHRLVIAAVVRFNWQCRFATSLACSWADHSPSADLSLDGLSRLMFAVLQRHYRKVAGGEAAIDYRLATKGLSLSPLEQLASATCRRYLLRVQSIGGDRRLEVAEPAPGRL